MTGEKAIELAKNLAATERFAGRTERASIMDTFIQLLRREMEKEITAKMHVGKCPHCGKSFPVGVCPHCGEALPKEP